jgi:hypothetical protein
VPANPLPSECPYTLEQILDKGWLPKNVHGIVDSEPEGS